VTNSGGGGDDGGGALAAGVAVPIAVLALAAIAAVVLYLVIRRWRYKLTPPPVALRRGSQYAGTPLHDHTPFRVQQHLNDMYSPHAEGFHGL
jgi:membrane protein implicated in regulation of membrane protease activity